MEQGAFWQGTIRLISATALHSGTARCVLGGACCERRQAKLGVWQEKAEALDSAVPLKELS